MEWHILRITMWYYFLLLLLDNVCGNVSIYSLWFHLSCRNCCFHHVGPVQNPGVVVESWRSSSCNLTHLLIDEGMGMLITVVIIDLAMWLPVVCKGWCARFLYDVYVLIPSLNTFLLFVNCDYSYNNSSIHWPRGNITVVSVEGKDNCSICWPSQLNSK